NAIAIAGPQLPKSFDTVMQDPFFARTNTLLNNGLSLVGLVPGVKNIPLPAMGAPILSSDQATLRLIAQHATTEHLTARPQAFHASDAGLAGMKADLDAGVVPTGKMVMIHATRDTLADYATSSQWASAMGAKLISYDSDSHVPEENRKEQGLLFQALRDL
ncbi:MAG TPA: hypothetical protein VGO62_17105, partial [Myxococcota bacterium]